MQRATGESDVARAEADRPELLFLCQSLPFPPDGGVHNRSYNVARLLSRSFDVTSLCFFRRATRSTDEAVERGVAGMAAIGHAEAFPIPQEWSWLRMGWDHARSLVTRSAYTRFAYESRSFRERLTKLLASRQFDIVHLDSLDLSAYVSLLSGRPTVCTHHNCEHELLERRARAAANPLMRAYLGLQARWTEAEVEEWCPRFDLNVVVSEHDRRALGAIAPEAEYLIVENGVDVDFFHPAVERAPERHGTDPRIVFVGGYSWYPNRDGMRFFCTEILPHVRARTPGVRVTWVGRAPEATRREFADRFGVQLTGYVDDVRPHVWAADCYVVPIRVGGGTRVKVVDAWAMGSALVSTTVGAEGLATAPGGNILLEDEPRRFADAVVRVLSDEALRRRLGQGGRRTAETRYAWSVIGGPMTERYLEIAGRRNPAGGTPRSRSDLSHRSASSERPDRVDS